MRVKIFNGYKDDVEKEINNWIKEREKSGNHAVEAYFKIYFVKQNILDGSTPADIYLAISIWYEY